MATGLLGSVPLVSKDDPEHPRARFGEESLVLLDATQVSKRLRLLRSRPGHTDVPDAEIRELICGKR